VTHRNRASRTGIIDSILERHDEMVHLKAERDRYLATLRDIANAGDAGAQMKAQTTLKMGEPT
jgi:hypothetical protein